MQLTAGPLTYIQHTSVTLPLRITQKNDDKTSVSFQLLSQEMPTDKLANLRFQQLDTKQSRSMVTPPTSYLWDHRFKPQLVEWFYNFSQSLDSRIKAQIGPCLLPSTTVPVQHSLITYHIMNIILCELLTPLLYK